MTTTQHKLGPVAEKTVETIRRYPDIERRHIHAVIAAADEARAALHAYDQGWIGARDLEGRLRDILAICEAVAAPVPPVPVPAGVTGLAIGTRRRDEATR